MQYLYRLGEILFFLQDKNKSSVRSRVQQTRTMKSVGSSVGPDTPVLLKVRVGALLDPVNMTIS